MSSDADYAAFLDKANQDPSEGHAKTSGAGKKGELKTMDQGVEVPHGLAKVADTTVYTSDADEPFVPVALKFGGKSLPDEDEFARLIQHSSPDNADITIQDPVDWDSQGNYTEVVDAVRRASKGNDVRVYRVGRDGTRVEYWVVTVDGHGAGSTLLGLKALAIES